MGLDYSTPEYQQPDHIKDFNFSLFKPTATPVVHLKRGPRAEEMTLEQSAEIHLTLKKIIDGGDTYNKSLYQQYCCAYCCVSLFTIPCWVVIPTLAGFGGVYWFGGDYFDKYRTYTYLAIAGLAIMTIIQCYCYCCTAQGLTKSAAKWRINIIDRVNEAVQDWQQQWPEFAMTIIYPIIDRGRKGKTRNIRGILRISKGTQPQSLETLIGGQFIITILYIIYL